MLATELNVLKWKPSYNDFYRVGLRSYAWHKSVSSVTFLRGNCRKYYKQFHRSSWEMFIDIDHRVQSIMSPDTIWHPPRYEISLIKVKVRLCSDHKRIGKNAKELEIFVEWQMNECFPRL